MHSFVGIFRKVSWRRVLVWGAIIVLSFLALKDVRWTRLLDTASRLQLWQLALLASVNVFVVAAFALRLFLLLPAVNLHFSLGSLARYWLAGFTVSYLTPGPQFGGGPVQVFLMQRDQRVPLGSTISAVATSKLILRVGNAVFLLIGLRVLLDLHLFHHHVEASFLIVDALLLLVPLLYLIGIIRGRRPLSAALTWLQSVSGDLDLPELKSGVRRIEGQAGDLCRRSPGRLLAALAVSVSSWAPILLETWLALRFLGFPVTWLEALATITAAQLAFLTPLPAGLGALEAVLVFSLAGLGLPNEAGVALALLVRARDVGLTLLGLAFGGAMAMRIEPDDLPWIREEATEESRADNSDGVEGGPAEL